MASPRAMAEHIEHEPLGAYEGHPVLTPLRDAHGHLQAVLAQRYRVAVNRDRLRRALELIRADLSSIEDDYAGRIFQ